MIKIVDSIKTINNNEVQLLQVEPYYCEKVKTVLFIGVTHGDEPQGEFLINKFIHTIKNNDKKIKNKLLFLPCLNPDGKELKSRGNKNGVDLNRNFPTKNWEVSEQKDSFYSGHKAASEIETNFLMQILKNHSPHIIFSLHAPYKIVNFDGPAKNLARKLSLLNGYPVQDYIGYPTPGSFGTYAGIERNIQTITLELPDNIDNETLWKQNKECFNHLAFNE